MNFHGKDIKIFTGSSNIDVAQGIAGCLGIPLGKSDCTQFSDGEISVSLNESVRGSDCFIVQSSCAPVNDNLMEMLIMIDAMKRASAARITAVMPYFGYARQDRKAKARDPITDLLLYYAGKTDQEPAGEYVMNNIKYQLVSDANLFCEENYDTKTCKRVYLYSTTNPAAGAPILDIQIDDTAIIDGWQTVRTQNEKALYDDRDEYAGDMWFIHMKRTTETPKYVSEIVVGWGNDAEAKAMLLAAGCDYMLQKDLNNNVGAHSDYVYLGYKRTSDPNQAIRNIISVRTVK